MTAQRLKGHLFYLQSALQPVGIALVALAALAGIAATGLAFGGMLPWPEVTIGYGGDAVQAGAAIQIGLTALLVMFCLYMPGAIRVQRLETSHRRFHMSMDDVVRAYHAAHAADRTGAFAQKHEFDAVRERLAYLREHPDLGSLEADVLEIAAQMSQVSHQLADTYSDDKMARARDFLRQRQQEVDMFNARLGHAKALTQELTHWARQVELEESVAQSQLDRLRGELAQVMPALLPPAARISPRGERFIDLESRAAMNTTPAE